jgi:hypothetical protein
VNGHELSPVKQMREELAARLDRLVAEKLMPRRMRVAA